MERLDVTILDRTYSLACAPEEKDVVLAAAEHVHRTMEKVRDSVKAGTSPERIAILAALQVAADLLRTPVTAGNQGSFALGDYKRKIEEMQRLVDDALAGAGAPGV